MGPAHDPVDTRALTLLSQQLDDGVVATVVAAYLDQLPPRTAALSAAVDFGGTPLRDAAHALTASSLMVGAVRLGHLCRDVEAAVERDEDDRARELAERALVEIDDVADALASTRWAPTTR